jgi:hypothetical protein
VLVELAGRNSGGQGDLGGVGEALAGQRLAANSRHHASCRLSQQAPLGMNTCRMRGWSASQVRVATLVWLERLSVITRMSPAGLAASTSSRNRWSLTLLGEAAVQVTAGPSATRSPPYTQVLLDPTAVGQRAP